MPENRASRAQQFMPFAALKGYYGLIREKERLTQPKKELSDDAALTLSHKLSQIERGQIVKVTYYHVDAYEVIEGKVSRIDTTFHTLTVIKTVIPLEDILDIERLEMA